MVKYFLISFLRGFGVFFLVSAINFFQNFRHDFSRFLHIWPIFRVGENGKNVKKSISPKKMKKKTLIGFVVIKDMKVKSSVERALANFEADPKLHQKLLDVKPYLFISFVQFSKQSFPVRVILS